MDENIGRNFSLLNISACCSTTRRAMNKWIAQADSAHWISLWPTPHGVLIVCCWWCTRGWRFLLVWATFWSPKILCFGLYLHNHCSYGQTEDNGGFSASNWSKFNTKRFSDCRVVMLYKAVKQFWAEFLLAEFSAFLLVTQEPKELW